MSNRRRARSGVRATGGGWETLFSAPNCTGCGRALRSGELEDLDAGFLEEIAGQLDPWESLDGLEVWVCDSCSAAPRALMSMRLP